MTREEATKVLNTYDVNFYEYTAEEIVEAIDMAVKALQADTVSQSEQYKKGFEDAKRAFLVEYARESENMRKRNAQLEVMLNAQKELSAEPVRHGKWKIKKASIHPYGNDVRCSECGYIMGSSFGYNYCPYCGAKMDK